MAICRENGMRIHRYWSVRSAPHTDDLETTVEYIRTLLQDTIKRQLIADVPLVTLLSGGLDSSGITALAGRAFARGGKELHTYSVDFVESAQHFRGSPMHVSLDAPWAKRVSEHVGTQHHTVVLDTPELVEHVLTTLYAHDYPIPSQMWSSLYLLFRAMKQEATVALSGESADEVFGGYPWFHNEAALTAQSFPWLPLVELQGENALSWLSPAIVQKVRMKQHLEQRYRQAMAEVPRLEGEDGLAARRREMFYMNQTYLLSCLLERKDRMSMATSLEVRVPFCDYRLVEYVWNIPWEMKMVDGIEKGLLRRVFADVLPEDVVRRKKSAYPTVQHPAYKEATRKWALDIVNNSNAPIQPLLDPRSVRALTENEATSPVILTSLAERIIQINEWLKHYQVTLSL